MRSYPPLTFQGALKILGRDDPAWLSAMDVALGSAILTAGVAAATVGGPVLGPLVWFTALWGWVDQKNEAMSLLRRAHNRISEKISVTRGYERVELIGAAHTTIVMAAFFEAVRESLGKSAFQDLKLTEQDMQNLLPGGRQGESGDASSLEGVVRALYNCGIHCPSAANGFEENLADVWVDLEIISNLAERYLSGLSSFKTGSWKHSQIVKMAADRYRSYYLSLAERVPEFFIWASFGEHAATRHTLRTTHSELISAFDNQRESLTRIESLLTVATSTTLPSSDLSNVLGLANRHVLGDPVVDTRAEYRDLPIKFPSIADAYLNPRYRLATKDLDSRPSDESWWEQHPIHDDLDVLLAGHVTALDAFRTPLLLLGHPGAGKSLLTKVLAARLPAALYTVVRVPLRRVSANSPVHEQIRQALDLATNGRIDWAELVEESNETVRVVLLDGLDELLQATAHDRGGYLREVMEFQRVEYAQERPVVVIVTSRTVVADRVEIAEGTPIVKLDDFDEAQIRTWIDRWNEANAVAIEMGRLGPIRHNAALAQRDLASQPLLLLMLALYCADPQAPGLDADLSKAALYRELIVSFARREARKQAPGGLAGDRLRDAVDRLIRRLAIASLGMFNRGRQDISERELGHDLVAIDELAPGPTSLDESGQRVLAEFFFVHAAEAQLVARDGVPTADRAVAPIKRTYEFLHATFGEYLVAARIVEELADMADVAFGGRRPRDPDDSLLFALTSHHTIANRRPVLDFARQLLDELSHEDRANIDRTLDILIGTYRHRPESTRFTNYQPTPPDRLRRLAAYSSNLVLLKLLLTLSGGRVLLSEVLRTQGDPLELWRSTVDLWRAGLDTSGWQAILSTVFVYGGEILPMGDSSSLVVDHEDILYARLTGNRLSERKLRLGVAVDRQLVYDFEPDDDWFDVAHSVLLTMQRGFIVLGDLSMPPATATVAQLNVVAKEASLVLFLRSRSMPKIEIEHLIKWLWCLPLPRPIDPFALAAAISAHPMLLLDFPDLADPKQYRDSGALLLLITALQSIPNDDSQGRHALKHLVETLHAEANMLSLPTILSMADELMTWLAKVSGMSEDELVPERNDIKPRNQGLSL